jgi:hypothetical protein
MKNRLVILITLASILLITGCAKKFEQRCNFPGTDTLAPDWVCDKPVEGWAVSAPGSAEKTAAGYDFQKQMAMTSARVQLAQQIKVHVGNMIKQYAEVTGAAAADTETVDQVRTDTTKQITDQSLEGSKVVQTVQGPNGTLWVLMAVDANAMQTITKNAVKTSMNNEQALWQKFQAKMSQDEMADAIAKQKVSE